MSAELAELPGRELVQIFELDQPMCSRTYGDLSGGCTAVLGTTGTHRCYNTFGSCQVQSVYALDEVPLTIRFAKPHAGVPRDVYHLPLLQSVSAIPARLNFGARLGRDAKSGRRPRVTVALQDAPGADTRVDPYLEFRGWDPLERGTWWAKWLRRNPYHAGMVARIREGWAGQALEDMRVSEYRVEKIEGPDSSGRVTVSLTDPIGVAISSEALYPTPLPSTLVGKYPGAPYASGDGTAYEDIVTIASAGVLAPGHGPGVIRIDDELISFTSTIEGYPFDVGVRPPPGGAILRGCTYGYASTVSVDHTPGVRVEQAVVVSGIGAAEVVKNLLTDGAGYTPSAAELADWAAEYTAHVPATLLYRVLDPTKVKDILAELAEQAGFVLWWDPELQRVRMRAAYRAETPAITLTEDRHILAGSWRLTQRPDERVTEVWVYYALAAGADPTDRGSYTKVLAQVDPVVSSPHAYADSVVYEVLAPWVVEQAHAEWLAPALLGRYKAVPEYAAFAVDARLEDTVGIALVVGVQHRALTDETGATETRQFQVISVNRVGDRLELELRPWEDLS